MGRQRAHTEGSAQGDHDASDTRGKPPPADSKTALARQGSQHVARPSQGHDSRSQSPSGTQTPTLPRNAELKELPSQPPIPDPEMPSSTLSSQSFTTAGKNTPQGKELSSDTPSIPNVSSDTAINAGDSSTDPWSEHRKAYDECPIDPPITPETLLELESNRIFNNPKLRHDVNFDRDLHFRPNSDGNKGKAKAKQVERYWKALTYELHLIETSLAAEEDFDKTFAVIKRVPAVFTSVREIMLSLVPEIEQYYILARIDVPFMTKQIARGLCDLHDLASWLSKIIKTHCAPMRDAKVDAFERAVYQAATTLDLANALAELVNIMEAMKLDVANHQIRHVRPFLINNTVEFQKRYNEQRVLEGKIDTNKAIKWLESELINTYSEVIPTSPLDALCSALLWDIVSPHGHEPYPPTFYLDYARLRELSQEVHMMIMKEICSNLARRDVDIAAIGLDIANLAVEIARDNEDHNVKEIAALLKATTTISPLYARHKSIVFHRLLPKYQVTVHQCINMTALELHNALVPPPSTSRKSPFLGRFGARLVLAQEPVLEDPDANFVRRLSQMTVLHWQVWADMLYLNGSAGQSNEEPSPAPAQETSHDTTNSTDHLEAKGLENDTSVPMVEG